MVITSDNYSRKSQTKIPTKTYISIEIWPKQKIRVFLISHIYRSDLHSVIENCDCEDLPHLGLVSCFLFTFLLTFYVFVHDFSWDASSGGQLGRPRERRNGFGRFKTFDRPRRNIGNPYSKAVEGQMHRLCVYYA